jgi:LCP family protein required for cell wall assembly
LINLRDNLNNIKNRAMINEQRLNRDKKAVFKDMLKKRWVKILLIALAFFLVIGGLVSWKAGSLLNRISTNGNFLGSIGHMVPGVGNQLQGEKEGRVNIMLLGMRGADDPAGGNLADSIMVVSLKTDPKDSKISMISIPRDLYVQDIQNNGKSKLNAIYAQGYAKGGSAQALKDMEQKLSEISGITINYGMMINHQGFKDLITALGGVSVTLDKPFEETSQFNQLGVCDGIVFTKPSGQFENKIVGVHHVTLANGQTKVVKVKKPLYPLCYNTNPECGGDFKLQAGTQTLNADQALCFARSRDNTSDFDRAKRQQIILQQIKAKALSIGTLTDFNKVNGMINALGNNVATDLQGWEMKRFFDLEQGMKTPPIIQRVLENTEEGLLYNPEQTPETGYILLPIGDNYDKIHALFQNIFTAPAQSDIKPK